MSEEADVPRIKQVIVVRTDLKMSVGKIGSQVAHASLAVLTHRLQLGGYYPYDERESIDPQPYDDAMTFWLHNSFTKICLAIDSEQDLLDLYAKAEAAGLPRSKIEDNGATVFHGVKTLTCCAFGPCPVDVLDELTGHLKLLR